MIRLAVVEDNIEACQQYISFIKQYSIETGESIMTFEFHDGDEIVEKYSSDYDIILMDIEMQFMNGMDAAKEIRKVDPRVIIIFMTNAPQFAMEGYKVDALDYVLKPIDYYDFTQHLNRAISKLSRRQSNFLKINVKGGIQKLDISKLMMVEVIDHELIYHMTDGDVSARGTMRELEQALLKEGFFRCNKCYLVNLAFVDGVRGNDVNIGGTTIQVSRAHRKALLDALNDFLNDVAK